MTHLVGVDLGNESGRIMAVHFDGGRIGSEEVYRFANHPVRLGGTLYWDVLRLWHEIELGLARALATPSAGIALDSFGVDFGLLDARGQLIANPVHMRDSRTEGMMEWVLDRVPREVLFARTGIGFYVINTLYQLVALKQQAPWQLEAAQSLLTMPNLLNYWLTGEKLSEFTHTTTTQCYNPLVGDWDRETLDTLALPTHILPPVVAPGIQIGSYRDVPVFAVASHDTASAVVAVPTETERYVYISSGTWSLIGVEAPAPLLTDSARDANFTNEGGACDTYRLLKMVMGLWLLQECRSTWGREGINADYDRLLGLAKVEPAFAAFIDPDDPIFFAPGDMPARIRAFCQATGQAVPQTVGQVVRCLFESLALKYRYVVEQLAEVTGQPVEVIHIVGGGSQNGLLCQMTANAAGIPVLAGPVEATALGNGLVQLIALGELHTLADARSVVRTSFPPARYDPRDRDDWHAAYERFKHLLTVP